MWRYDIVDDARHLSIKKRWAAYLTTGLRVIGSCVLPLVAGIAMWQFPSPRQRVDPQWGMFFVASALLGISLAGIYTCWKILRSDTYLFDARLHMFERNGQVISHWDGITKVEVTSVAHRRNQRRGLLSSLFNEEEFRYTYRVAVLLASGRRITLDEYGDRVEMDQLAAKIAGYINKPMDRDPVVTALF